MAISGASDHDATAFPDPLFEMRDHLSGGRHTLMLHGELDLAHAHELEATIGRLGADAVSEIAIDLSGLSFVDSTGIRAILSAQAHCQALGCEFLLIPGGPEVQRIFDIAGLTAALPFQRG
ncbi:MAG TPA: STAS domain-containing protein [Solirubrobacteraceae bacterium]|jgi:anti-sigma B factor antagonist